MDSLRACVISNRMKWFVSQRFDDRLLNMLLVTRDVARYARASMTDWKKREKIPPDTLSIGSVDVCNAKCCFCAYKYYSPSKTVTDLETTKNILDQYQELGGVDVDFNPLVCEPLLDPYLCERIRYAVGKGLHVFLFTNGILLNRGDNVDKLVESGMNTLFISIHGFNPDMYRQIYGVDKYHEVLSGVRKLIAKNREMGEPISVKLLIRSGETAAKIFGSEDYRNHIKPYMDYCNVEIVRAFDNWCGLLEGQMPGRLFLRAPPPIRRRPCLRTFHLPAVLSNGDFRLCECRFGREFLDTRKDELIVGNVHSESIRDLWYGDKAKRVRRMFTEGHPPKVCIPCSNYLPA